MAVKAKLVGHTGQPFSLKEWLRSLWSFSRPHTIVGTALSIAALGVMAITLTPPITALVAWNLGSILAVIGAALIPSLCANIYIVGLNQLTDIEIDRINKPHLPLAAGLLSPLEGQWIVSLMGGTALLSALLQGPVLLATVVLSMAIGTVYSLPPLRLKRFPFWAALCIVGVRGVVVNLGFFVHFRQLLSQVPADQWLSYPIPPEIWALTMFVVLFALAIAIFKDIPDLAGDQQFQIYTLTVRLGTEFVFRLSRWVLTLCYGLLIGLSLLNGLPSVQPLFLVTMHLGLLGLMWWMSFRVNLHEKSEVSQFYQFIWRLFFLEYLLFPIACVIGR